VATPGFSFGRLSQYGAADRVPNAVKGEAMLKSLNRPASLAVLAMGLGGCVAGAGVSTWSYRSEPGFQTERIAESRIYGDPVRGIGSSSCTSVVTRQAEPTGRIASSETTACEPGSAAQSIGRRNERLP
jgi:hypothetical protein